MLTVPLLSTVAQAKPAQIIMAPVKQPAKAKKFYQRQPHDVAQSKKFPACFKCQRRRVKCSNTKSETGFPCTECKNMGLAAECLSAHKEDPRWRTGMGSTNHYRPRKSKQQVQASPDSDEDEDDDFRAPLSGNAAPSRRSVRSTRAPAKYSEWDEDSVSEDKSEGSSSAESDRDESDPDVGDNIVVAGKAQVKNGDSGKPAALARLESQEKTLGKAADDRRVRNILNQMYARLAVGDHQGMMGMQGALRRAAARAGD